MGFFSDLADAKGEDVFFQKNNYSSVDTELNLFDSHLGRTQKKITKKQPVINKDCVKMPTGGDKLDVCKNVNSSCIQKPHSNVQMPQTNYRELKVVLCRLPNTLMINGRTVKLAESNSIRKKCDRGKTPPKSVRRRKSMDKSENKIDKAPSRVQNHKLSPLQDINPRVPPKKKFEILL
ncbi:hypothetical protein NQ317_006995 [Molorchus minor]|uniref:Uncharacterized protein n=1 Tax=Molorchus minor TaxID=1323400 RepID=A0ABQ9JT40_9CUCU|nr:hypothetical protein NQ317_006995 [Molorchus minor]